MRKFLSAIFVGAVALTTAQVKVSESTYRYTGPAGFVQTRSSPIQLAKGETATITVRVTQAKKQSLKLIVDRYIQAQRKDHDSLIVLSESAVTLGGQSGRTANWTYLEGTISVRERMVLASKGNNVAILFLGSVKNHEEIDKQFMASLKSFKWLK